MSDATADTLLARAGDDWSIFEELGSMSEPERRDLLRFHRERGVTSPGQIGRRARLDEALDRLALLELGVETGVITEEQARFDSIPYLKELFERSSAFVRYGDNYLSLSLRFVAERLQVALPLPQAEVNELPVPRPCPPPLDTAACRAPEAVARFLGTEPASDDIDIKTALLFLDDFALTDESARFGLSWSEQAAPAHAASREQRLYELWVRGLVDRELYAERFTMITRGLVKYARLKARFYSEIDRYADEVAAMTLAQRGEAPPLRPDDHVFFARSPITARIGLYDLYWIARLLRAEVSPAGTVSYTNGSWLELLAKRARELEIGEASGLLECDSVLRGVLDYTCDLVQNAVDIVQAFLDDVEKPGVADRASNSWDWRRVQDEELDEIRRERLARRGSASVHRAALDVMAAAGGSRHTPALPPDRTRPHAGGPGGVGWSRRILTGDHEPDLVGLAISGGGIRSATIGLGILQHLQQLDLLRHVDFLSTVSGGGYIGSWLVGNVHRNRYWLTEPTDWSPSIRHLRRFSNYLSPQLGLLSADAWTMWGSWIRNTFLIQLSAVAWLCALMVAVMLGGLGFAWQAPSAAPGLTLHTLTWFTSPRIHGHVLNVTMPGFLGTFVCLGVIGLCLTLMSRLDRTTGWRDGDIQRLIVVPSMLGAGLASGALWTDLPPTAILSPPAFSSVFFHGLRTWWFGLLLLTLSFLALAYKAGSDAPFKRRVRLSLLSALLSIVGTALVAAAVAWTYNHRDVWGITAWHAYTFGPSLMLIAPTVGIVLMLGVLGLDCPDWRREWWTRLGSWTAIYAAAALAVTSAGVFGPWLILAVFDRADDLPKTTITGVVAWLGTVLGGLVAGDNTRSEGETVKSTKAWAISLFARVAAVVFIASALCLVATLVYMIAFNLSADGTFTLDTYWSNLALLDARWVFLFGIAALAIALTSSYRFDLNTFGLNQFYRNRLVRCYLGATRWQPGKRKPHHFTGFDAGDEIDLADLRHEPLPKPAPQADEEKTVEGEPIPFRGPYPIINGALNLGGSSDLALHTRHSASFIMTPLRCGADRPSVGYAPTRTLQGEFATGVTLGQAVSISGAAASPNMGYDTSPLVSFLLTMFNVRLGWWFPNPGRDAWDANRVTNGSKRLLIETFGLADEKSRFVNVSDGGHFENLGIYELVRRRCAVIIASDGECDDDMAFGSLGRVIRMCRTDFAADIDIDVESIRRVKGTRMSRAHCAVGRITYANGRRGFLIYLKSSLTGDEDVDVQQYHSSHAEFPHESTADQFFAEDQFESYRKLGQHIAGTTFRGAEDCGSVMRMADRLNDIWVADGATGAEFVGSTEALVALWERMRTSAGLAYLFQVLHGVPPSPAAQSCRSQDDEQVACLELIQLLENTYVGLHLEEHWTHPDNQGWVELFSMWARCDPFRAAWKAHRHLFGTRFGYFCQQRLGLA